MKIKLNYTPVEEKIELLPTHLAPLHQLVARADRSVRLAQKAERKLWELRREL